MDTRDDIVPHKAVYTKANQQELDTFEKYIRPSHDVPNRYGLFVVGSYSFLERYLQEYLQAWQEGEVYSKERVLYKPSKQILTILRYIKVLLEDFAPHHLLLRQLPLLDQVSFVGALLYFEKRGWLTTEGFEVTSNPEMPHVFKILGMRVSVQPSFMEVFPTLDLDMEYFQFVLNRDAFSKRLIFNPPEQLIYKNTSYDFHKGSIPYHFMAIALENKGKVSLAELELLTKSQETELVKNVNNFRVALRKKFPELDEESFFIKEHGEWVCDMQLFFFFPKKVKVRLFQPE